MRFTSVPPTIDAELAYRREQIAHDFAVAHGWELSIRRLFGRHRSPAQQPRSHKDSALATPDRLGWR